MSIENVDNTQKEYAFIVTTDKRTEERMTVKGRTYELASLDLIRQIIEDQKECLKVMNACENYAV